VIFWRAGSSEGFSTSFLKKSVMAFTSSSLRSVRRGMRVFQKEKSSGRAFQHSWQRSRRSKRLSTSTIPE